jgi:hypothetical protein
MANDRGPGSFEDFVAWLGTSQRRPKSGDGAEPSTALLAAAVAAHQEFQSLRQAHREQIATRVRTGGYREDLELMAAADTDQGRWLPRLRTPNGFAISALYATNSAAGAPPIGLLLECPAELIDVFRGQKAYVCAAGRWVEIGEIDMDGKAMGDLPPGVEFKPPFSFRVGDEPEEDPEELKGYDDPNLRP